MSDDKKLSLKDLLVCCCLTQKSGHVLHSLLLLDEYVFHPLCKWNTSFVLTDIDCDVTVCDHGNVWGV